MGGCKDAACVTTWISESQDQDLCSRNSTSHLTHNNVTSCLMSLSADVFFSQFFFPPRLLHCNCSSLLVVTPPFSSQRQPSSKGRKRGVSLASILEPLSLAANLAISCGYHLKTVSPQQCTPLSTKIFPARLFSPRIPDLFVSSPSPHDELLDDDLSVSHYTLLLLLLRKKWSSSFAGSSMCLNIFFRFVSLFF